jgi:hypothetical protein
VGEYVGFFEWGLRERTVRTGRPDLKSHETDSNSASYVFSISRDAIMKGYIYIYICHLISGCFRLLQNINDAFSR